MVNNQLLQSLDYYADPAHSTTLQKETTRTNRLAHAPGRPLYEFTSHYQPHRSQAFVILLCGTNTGSGQVFCYNQVSGSLCPADIVILEENDESSEDEIIRMIPYINDFSRRHPVHYKTLRGQLHY